MVASVALTAPRGLVVVTVRVVLLAVRFAAITVRGERPAVLRVMAELGPSTVAALAVPEDNRKTAAMVRRVRARREHGARLHQMVAVPVARRG
jgi:hypothetical protein